MAGRLILTSVAGKGLCGEQPGHTSRPANKQGALFLKKERDRMS
jgi:hypothetical protein